MVIIELLSIIFWNIHSFYSCFRAATIFSEHHLRKNFTHYSYFPSHVTTSFLTGLFVKADKIPVNNVIPAEGPSGIAI